MLLDERVPAFPDCELDDEICEEYGNLVLDNGVDGALDVVLDNVLDITVDEIVDVVLSVGKGEDEDEDEDSGTDGALTSWSMLDNGKFDGE